MSTSTSTGDGGGDDEPRNVIATGQTRKIDVQIPVRPFALNIARQHAGIGGSGLRRHQRQPQAGKRRHGELAQHCHLGMAAAQQDKLTKGGVCHQHQGLWAPSCPLKKAAGAPSEALMLTTSPTKMV